MRGGCCAAIGMCGVLFGTFACADGPQERFLRRSEISEIAEHIRELPPYRSDVTVIVEFSLSPVPESELRQSVEKMYRAMDREQGKVPDETKFAEEVDKEVQRLLQEQLLPRRIKERWRREGLRYRVDEVRTYTGLETIDASSEWQRSFLYLSEGPGSPRDTAKRDWAQKILSVFGQRHGNVQAVRDVWSGGTVGLETALLLKRALGMNSVAREGGGNPVEERVAELLDGRHAEIDVRVIETAGEPGSREFRVRPKKSGGQITFVAPVEGLSPIRSVEIRNAFGSLRYRMEVESADENGIATKWVEESIRIPAKGLEQRQFELIERHLNQPLEADTFSISRPDGWTLADHRPDKLVVIGPEGRPEAVAKPAVIAAAVPRSRIHPAWWVIIAYVIAAMTIGYSRWVVWSRRKKKQG